MTIAAGALDRRVIIERTASPSVQSPSGQPVEIWEVLVGPVWASIAPLRGSERSADPNVSAHEEVEIRLRWSSAVANVDPKDRVAHRNQLYDILAVHEIGRREGLRIIARRKAD